MTSDFDAFICRYDNYRLTDCRLRNTSKFSRVKAGFITIAVKYEVETFQVSNDAPAQIRRTFPYRASKYQQVGTVHGDHHGADSLMDTVNQSHQR